MASSGREKMASRFASKRKSSSAAAGVFKEEGERRSEREGGRMGAKKRPSRQRSAWIDPGGDHPKVAVEMEK